jgi:hypothetical protein
MAVEAVLSLRCGDSRIPRRNYVSNNAEVAAGQRKRSVLEDHLDVVGVLHDKEVAELLGMTAGGVRAYRQRHNIPAGWRAGSKSPSAKARRRTPTKARSRVAKSPGSSRAKRTTKAPSPVISRGRRRAGRRNQGPVRTAFTVVAKCRRGEVTAVAMATSPSEAAALALKHFQASDPRAHVVGVTPLATVL